MAEVWVLDCGDIIEGTLWEQTRAHYRIYQSITSEPWRAEWSSSIWDYSNAFTVVNRDVHCFSQKDCALGFPGGPVVKNLPCNAARSLVQEDPTYD